MNIFDVFNHAPMLHAAVVHLPIVLAMAGMGFVLACGVFEENRTLRVLLVLVFGGMVVTTQYAIMSGEYSRATVPSSLSDEIWSLLDQHELMAERVRVGALVCFVCALLALVKQPVFRKGMLLVTGLASFATMLLVSTTAHFGGTLVYTHGVGTKALIEHERHRERPVQGAAEPAAPAEQRVAISAIDPEAAKAVDYQRDVWPILEKYCLDCHSAPEADGGYDVSTIENLMKAGEESGPGVIPGDPDGSALVKYIRGELKPRMPHKEPPMAPELLHTIRLWISAGALPAAGAPGAVPAPEAAPVAEPVAAQEPAPAPEAAPAAEEPAPAFNPFG